MAKCTSPERGLGGAADDGVSEAVGEVIALLTGEAPLGMVNVKDIRRGIGEGGVHSMMGLADMKKKQHDDATKTGWRGLQPTMLQLILKETDTAGLLRISERTGHLVEVNMRMKMQQKRSERCCGGGVL